jgi:hypothetical protein
MAVAGRQATHIGQVNGEDAVLVRHGAGLGQAADGGDSTMNDKFTISRSDLGDLRRSRRKIEQPPVAKGQFSRGES